MGKIRWSVLEADSSDGGKGGWTFRNLGSTRRSTFGPGHLAPQGAPKREPIATRCVGTRAPLTAQIDQPEPAV